MTEEWSSADILDAIPSPPLLVWDITYACPLRCAHCYSESGRRASRQLDPKGLLRVVDALIAGQPRAVVLSGGEPLAVKGIAKVMAALHEAGIGVILYTGGWPSLTPLLLDILEHVDRVTVSLDGATAETHDRIRGRRGSFDRACKALAVLDQSIRRASDTDSRAPALGIDMVVMRCNLHEVPALCTTVAGRYPALSAISLGAVIPTGLASRESFAASELLSDDEARGLLDPPFIAKLQAQAPAHALVSVTDIRMFQLSPDLIAAGIDIPPLQIEPDGRVRAMPIYEGTVGSLLEDPLEVLWSRAVARWRDPFVVESLQQAGSMQLWAGATRRLDMRFSTAEDRARIAQRPFYAPQETA
jgi:MoaA/NifB/PqqE/SkfB family radical SAM enzyme